MGQRFIVTWLVYAVYMCVCVCLYPAVSGVFYITHMSSCVLYLFYISIQGCCWAGYLLSLVYFYLILRLVMEILIDVVLVCIFGVAVTGDEL